MASTDSPTKRMAMPFVIHEDCADPSNRTSTKHGPGQLPLTSSKLANQLPLCISAKTLNKEQQSPMEQLLAKLSQHQEVLAREKHTRDENGGGSRSSSAASSDPFATTPPAEVAASSHEGPNASEVWRLKKELELTRERMAQMDLELTQSRIAQYTVEEAISTPAPDALRPVPNVGSSSLLSAQHNITARASPFRPHSRQNLTAPFFAFQQPSHVSSAAFNLTPIGSAEVDVFGPQSSDSILALPRSGSGFETRHGLSTDYAPSIAQLDVQAPFFLPDKASRPSQHPIGTRANSNAIPFPSDPQPSWYQVPSNTSAYVAATEPLNYRRLLDRNVSCDWKYIVDKIVCNNDQQASIFLQQKLKVGTSEQKFEIVNAIIDQAYALMVNRFGNFLVQRCFEHGTQEQVIAIAQAIRGNTLNLSMDSFGCHVIQKAFDCVPEEYKATMVHELLRRIPETVIHRYACHVWQKLFELRWSGSPPQIMKYVNEALRGMWHEVALGETGSLVVQNIFENCLEEDKRPCINEVLASIDVVAHGQFGNWCVQHVCEHGSVPDRTRAIDHVIRFATKYSTDQFASKVVEKCLKICGVDFLDRYLDRVCEAHPDRPRMPLVDIAGDQFGNYLVQYILTNADPQRREVVAAHIRKHMVSLRGSKYGSRVAMLCCNPALVTRPGPPAGIPLGRNNSCYGERFNDRQYGGNMTRGSFSSFR